MSISRPTIPVRSADDLIQAETPIGTSHDIIDAGTTGAVLKQDQMLLDLKELETILKEIERLKALCKSPKDWRVLMLYISTQKSRVSTMTSRAKKYYVQEFAEAYDAQYLNLGENEKPPSAKTAEIRAKSEAGTAYEVVDRMERTWKDMEALMWACKDVAASLDSEEIEAGFEAYPDHLFPGEKA